MNITKRLSLLIAYAGVVIADSIISIKRNRNQRNNRDYQKDAQDPIVARYTEYNRRVRLKNKTRDQNSLILMDCFPIPVWVAANSILANCLAEQNAAEIHSYGEIERNPYTDMLYKSFNCNNHMVVHLSRQEKKRRRELFFRLLGNVNSKYDIYSMEIDGVQIGDEVYETYLRNFSKPTFNINSFMGKYTLLVALNYYIFFDSLFKKKNIAALVLSHDIYTNLGIPAKMAWRNGVRVYLANGHEMKVTSRPNEKNQEFMRYPDYFKTLNTVDQTIGVNWAKEQLSKRFGGEVGVSMGYSTKSAYVAERIERQTAVSEKTKLVIATHCFFDNPRAYGGSLFIDYYEWLSFLGKVSEVTDYEWYIKTHRDYLPGTLETITEIIKHHPKIKLINSNTSWHQLRDEGVSVALTSYGSIGHELPLLGIKVINAGYNPHVAYDFNWHPKTVDEYNNILMNLNDLGEIRDVDRIYEFFFVHYKLAKHGGFLFDSFSDMERYVTKNVYSKAILEKVIVGGKDYDDEAKSRINSFINSGRFSMAEEYLYGARKP